MNRYTTKVRHSLIRMSHSLSYCKIWQSNFVFEKIEFFFTRMKLYLFGEDEFLDQIIKL